MLEKLQIRMFGANEKQDIEFSPHVTTLIGKSFIGKSWILRALRWVCRNKPAGDSYINWDGERANVRLITDGKKITRTRSPSINKYKLDKKSFAAFGNDVPPDIARVLNVSDINFQGVNTLGQHEPPFWFCETPGEVSRQLNTIVNLEVIDSTLSNIASEITHTASNIKITTKRLTTAIESKKSLLYIKDLDRELKVVEQSYVISAEIAHKRSTIAEQVKIYTMALKTKENSVKRRESGKFALSKENICRDLTNSKETLQKLVDNGLRFQKAIKAKPPSMKTARIARRKVKFFTKQVDSLKNLIRELDNSKETKCLEKTRLSKLMQELEQIAGDKCPLCGSKTKK